MDKFVPVVLDCEEILKGSSLQKFGNAVGSALKEDGFFHLINHGIPPSMVKTFCHKSKDFFELSPETKGKYEKKDEYFGFIPSGPERSKEVTFSPPGYGKREYFDFPCGDSEEESNYPSEIDDIIPIVVDFAKSLTITMQLLLRSIAVYLQLEDPEYLIKEHSSLGKNNDKSGTRIRSSYYNSLDSEFNCPEDIPLCRLTAHKDSGTMTLLFQDGTGGLESQLANGTWVPVLNPPDSIVVHIGKTLESYAGGNLRAAAHRVRLTNDNSKMDRQSIAFFIHPDPNTRCVPLVFPKDGWVPIYPELSKHTHAEYFRMRKIKSMTKQIIP